MAWAINSYFKDHKEKNSLQSAQLKVESGVGISHKMTGGSNPSCFIGFEFFFLSLSVDPHAAFLFHFCWPRVSAINQTTFGTACICHYWVESHSPLYSKHLCSKTHLPFPLPPPPCCRYLFCFIYDAEYFCSLKTKYMYNVIVCVRLKNGGKTMHIW